MEPFRFNELPPDMITEIAGHLPPRSAARFFASARSLRADAYTEQLKEKVSWGRQRRNLQRELIAKAVDSAQYLATRRLPTDASQIMQGTPFSQVDTVLSTSRYTVYIASPELTIALGSNFTQYQGQTLLLEGVISKWLHIYIILNQPDRERNIVTIDEVLAKLTGWPLNSQQDIYQLFVRVRINHLTTLPDDQKPLPQEIMEHLLFVSEYLRFLLDDLRERETESLREKRFLEARRRRIKTARVVDEYEAYRQEALAHELMNPPDQ